MATGIPVVVGELVDVPTINSWARGYLRKTTSKTVNTSPTTTGVDLLNSEFTLPAGSMGTDKIVRLSAWGDWKQNSGAARDIPRFQLKLGGTTMLDTGFSAVTLAAVDSNRHGWKIACEIQNLGAANSQTAYLSGKIVYSESATGALLWSDGASIGLGNGLTSGNAQGVGYYEGGNTGLAVDTTAACALVLNVYTGVNHANYEIKLYGALVEII